MLSRLFSKRTARALGAPVPRGLIVDADTLELVAEVDAGGRDGDQVAAADGVWFATHDDRSIALVDPDGAVLLKVDLPARPERIVLDGDRPLVGCGKGRLLRVDPVEGRILDDVRMAEDGAVVAGGGHIWSLVADDFQPEGFRLRLVKLDRSSLAPIGTVEVGRSVFHGAPQIHEDTVNVLLETAPRSMGYASFDLATGAPRATPPFLTEVHGMGERDGVRWAARDQTVRRIDVATGSELSSSRLDVPRAGGWLLAHGRVWVRAWRPPSERNGYELGS